MVHVRGLPSCDADGKAAEVVRDARSYRACWTYTECEEHGLVHAKWNGNDLHHEYDLEGMLRWAWPRVCIKKNSETNAAKVREAFFRDNSTFQSDRDFQNSTDFYKTWFVGS
jgi:hypothetical protein